MSGLNSASPIDARRDALAQALRARAGRPDPLPLSLGQQRLWAAQQLDVSSCAHNIAIAHHLLGLLDERALELALRAIIARHSILRATFATAGRQPTQTIAPPFDPIVVRDDLSAADPAHWRALARHLAETDAAQPFDLATGPLVRFRLIRRGPDEHLFVITVHHIVCDRWSLGLMSQDLSRVYASAVSGEAAPSVEPAPPYAEYVAWEQQALTGDAQRTDLAFWAARLGTDIAAARLPFERAAPAAPSHCGGRERWSFDAELKADVFATAERERVTPFVVLLAAFAELLQRQTGHDRLFLCIPVLGRHRPQSRGIVGYLNSILPLPLDVSSAASFRELLPRIAQNVKDAFEHQNASFHRIAELPELARVPWTRCLFSLQNTPSLALRLPGITADYEDVASGSSDFDLSVFLEERAGSLAGFADFRLDRFDPAGVRQLSGAYRTILTESLRNPDAPRLQKGNSLRALDVPVPLVETTSEDKSQGPAHADDASSTGYARNELERRVVAAFADVLGLRSVSRTDNFFELGGNSLAAARLFDRIERELGRELPLTMLLTAPTVERLTRLLADRGWTPSWSSLMPIQPEGSRPPLYMVHGGGGGILTYRLLAEQLGPDQPLWGLNTYGSARPPRPLKTVEEFATRYVEAIVSRQPAGPYLLGGHSFGALVALEMAQQLRAAGHDVPLLALFDFPGPDARITWRDRLRWHSNVLGQLEWRDRVPYITSRIRWRLHDRRIPLPLRKLFVAATSRGTTVVPSKRLENFDTALCAIEHYQPRPYAGRVTVFRARFGSPAIQSDPYGGWTSVAQGGVTVHEVPGQHVEMFDAPNVTTLAAALRDDLAAANAPTRTPA